MMIICSLYYSITYFKLFLSFDQKLTFTRRWFAEEDCISFVSTTDLVFLTGLSKSGSQLNSTTIVDQGIARVNVHLDTRPFVFALL